MKYLEVTELEARERMQNLMWTVAGDYSLDTRIDLACWNRTKYVAMYDAVRQGAFARFFDKDTFAMYMVKKMYYGGEMQQLTAIGRMCVETAVYPKVVPERPGVREIRQKAFDYEMDHHFHKMNQTLLGRIRLALMRGALTGQWESEKRIQSSVDKIHALENAQDSMDLIRAVDEIYNHIVDPEFVKKHGDLQHVLDATVEDMREFNWQDLLDEDAQEDIMGQLIEKLTAHVTASEEEEPEEREEEKKDGPQKKKITVVDEKALAQMDHYIQATFGKGYLDEKTLKNLNYRLCRGAHRDCKLYYTDGIIENSIMRNAQYASATRQVKNNENYLKSNASVAARNIELMTDYLKRSLLARTQVDEIPSYAGDIVPNKLWRIGRVPQPGKLFQRRTKIAANEFAVEILLDCSGSQRKRQSQVALQAYMISRALSNAGLPHRIMGFCTFWDYTVLQRFRDFDDPAAADFRVFQMLASSNNRDGLAIRAAGEALSQRPEENKILIILSDGKPNDVIINRPGSTNPNSYYGDYAVNDTAMEVRRVRGEGISVLGVFTGQVRDLAAEKKIFGKDFAYVPDIRNFSRVVSSYLNRILEQDAGQY